MRTICGAILLSAMMAASGCTSGFGFMGLDNPPPKKTMGDVTPQAPPGPVTADQVTSANAHQLANDLREEMNRD